MVLTFVKAKCNQIYPTLNKFECSYHQVVQPKLCLNKTVDQVSDVLEQLSYLGSHPGVRQRTGVVP